MQYLGGKSRLGRKIVDAIQPWRQPGSLWVEPFCGALNVTRWAPSPRLALDACQPLITTLQAVQQGWEPPDHVTPETYARIKANPDPWDPLTGFVMFGCSYGGSWGEGYAKNPGGRHGPEGQNFARMSSRALRAKVADCSDVVIRCLDYRRIPAPPPGTVVYADPPYRATKGYGALPKFDSDEFWQWADWWHQCGALVFVSEGQAAQQPPIWVTYRTWSVPSYLHREGPSRIREERLYVHRDSPMARSLTHHAQ